MAPERIPAEDLLEDVRRVAGELGRPPTPREYDEHGTHSHNTLYKHADGWQDVLEAAGFDPREADYYHTSDRLSAMDPEELGLSPVGEATSR